MSNTKQNTLIDIIRSNYRRYSTEKREDKQQLANEAGVASQDYKNNLSIKTEIAISFKSFAKGLGEYYLRI